MALFRGGAEPPLPEPPSSSAEGEESYQKYLAEAKCLARELGFRGAEALEEMWGLWRRYGGAGPGDSPEVQELRYSRSEEDSAERSPGLPRHLFRQPDVVATAGWDYLARTWDAESFELLQTFEGHTNLVNAVAQYLGKWLLTCADDGCLKLWRLGKEEMGVCERTIWVTCHSLKAMCLLPGQRCCVSAVDGYLRVISVFTGEILMRADGHSTYGPYENYWQEQGCGCVFGLLHVRDNVLASCSDDSTVRFWDFDRMRCLGVHCGHHGYGKEINSEYAFAQRFAPVWCLAHIGDGQRMASSSWDRTIVIWDISDLEHIKKLQTLRGHENSALSLAPLSSERLLSCGGDNSFRLWDLASGSCLCSMETRGHPLCALRLDGNRVAVGGADSTIRVFDWQASEDLRGARGFYAHELSISAMAPVHTADAEREDWLEPIMYRNEDPFRMRMTDQQYAREMKEHLRKQALSFAKQGEWGQSPGS